MYYSDEPIKNIEDDLLDRGAFAKMLAKSLSGLKHQETFTVGLYGDWGSGKTSLINMMLQELKELQKAESEKLYVVKFEPWNFTNEQQVLEQFLIRLSNEFISDGDIALREIGESLYRYSEFFSIANLIPGKGKTIGTIGKGLFNGISNVTKAKISERDFIKQKDKLIKNLSRINSRILVVIDDIDRLSNKQIQSIFQLISSVAKFPNLIYLLSFDKTVVSTALESIQNSDGDYYLEKIINMPISVPNVSKSDLIWILTSKLDQQISEYPDIIIELEYWQTILRVFINNYIKNMRNIKRLLNILEFKMAAISSEVNLADLVALSIFELEYPSVYSWVSRNKQLLTGDIDYSEISIRSKKDSEKYTHYARVIGHLLNKKYVDDEPIINDVLEKLSIIFPVFSRKIGRGGYADKPVLLKNNRVGHINKFDRYFDLNIDKVKISKADMLDATHTLDQSELEEFIIRCEEEGKGYELLEEFQANMGELEHSRIEILAKALINTSSFIEKTNNRGLLGVSSRSFAFYIVVKMLEILGQNNAMIFLSNEINHISKESIAIIAEIINEIELSFGRLAANGIEKSDKKIVSLEDLEVLEKLFINNIKSFLNFCSLFEIDSYRMVKYLLESFDPVYANEYITNQLKDNLNKLKLLDDCISDWRGNDVSYEIHKSYQEYLTQDEILDAIKTERSNGNIYDLPEITQHRCAAFYLDAEGEFPRGEHIPRKKVEELLEEWKATDLQ